MFCIVGLGNPGIEYKQTRHNAGFLVVDQVADHYRACFQKKGFESLYVKMTIEERTVLLVKPQTYMNCSGRAVFSLVNYFKIARQEVLVIYDDLDLPLGAIRMRLSGSAGGHRGLASIINQLGTSEFTRLRIGIGRPDEEARSVSDFVLSPFKGNERAVFDESIERAKLAVISFVTEGPNYAMNHFNFTPVKDLRKT